MMQTIVWDVDDVLNDLMKVWLERWWLPQHPTCPLGYMDLLQTPPHQLLGTSLDEYLASLDEFRLSSYTRQIEPVPDVYAWFVEYGDRARHMALTATPLRCVSTSAEWVFFHFGKWIRTYSFVPSFRPDDAIPIFDHSKVAYLEWLGRGDILVEDNQITANAARSMGISVVLIPRPWNSSKSTVEQELSGLTRMVA